MHENPDFPGTAPDLLPIRDVARLTGVNPVTLRAWERRYGLILPQRTPKGHRLYSHAQVEQIREVLGWLERGVAVGQVKSLLEEQRPATATEDTSWQERRNQLHSCIEALAERALDDCFNRAMALYPATTLCRHLLLPLLDGLRRRWRQPAPQLERVFFLSWLRSKLGARLYHCNRQHGGAPLLLLNLGEQPMEPDLWLCAWLASDAECPVQVLDWPVPPPQLAVAVRQLNPRAVLLYGDQPLGMPRLRQLLTDVPCPRLLCGPAVAVHQDALHALADLHLAGDPLEALGQLQHLGLLGGGASCVS